MGLPRPAGRDRGREGDRDDREEGHRGVRCRRVQPALPRVRPAIRRRVRGTHRADRLLDRHRSGVLDDAHRVHRVGLVVVEAAPRPRAPRRGLQGHGVLPAVRHRALGRRGGPGLRDGLRPERLRPVPDRRSGRPVARRFVAGRVDDDAVDTPGERGGSRRPFGVVPGGRARRGTADRRGTASRRRPRRRRHGRRDAVGFRPRRRPLRAAVPERRGRAPGGRRGLRLHGRGNRDRPHGAGLRTGGPRRRPSPGMAGLQARRRRRAIHRSRSRVRPRDIREGRGPRDHRGSPRAWRSAGRRDGRACVPVLLAVPHALVVLRAHRLVRPDDAGEGSPARRQRLGALVPLAYPARAVRQLAREQRRLGALTRALLGNAAADLAVRAPARTGGRVAHGAQRARRSRPDRHRSAQARHRRGVVRLSRVRGALRARPGGHRHVVRLGGDAVRAMGLSPRARSRHRGVRTELPRRLHLRGDRPDAWLVLHAHGRGRLALRRGGLPERRVSRADPRRRGPEDVEVARQQHRPVRRPRSTWRRHPPLVPPHERFAVGGPSRVVRGFRRDRPPVPADPLERVFVLRHVRERERIRSRILGRTTERPTRGDGPLGALAARGYGP